ncbi:MAG: universal stress protein [Acidobacteriota bacterium]|nr:universal stress protein [Acidobacteriota bacterium]
MPGGPGVVREAPAGGTDPERASEPHIRKILFPVDFRYTCYGTARYLEALSSHFDPRIMLLHAVEPERERLSPDLMSSRKLRLESFLASDLRYLKTERVCIEGKPSHVIVDVARNWTPDLIMLPSHGLGFFRRHFVGSVTASALREISCPVWTSLHGENAPSTGSIRFRKILCSLDLGKHSPDVLRWASWFASQYQAQLGVVHATEPVAAPGVWPQSNEFELQLSRRVRERIDELASQSNALASRVFVIPDSPALACSRAAREFGADLLVMGRHRVQSLPEDLIDHVYSIVAESPCPVVSV